MRNVLLIVKESIKQRKTQYLLLLLTLFLSTLMFTLAVNLLSVVSQPFDENFERLVASNLLLFFDSEADNYQQIADWFRDQPEVQTVSQPVPYWLFNHKFVHDEEQINVTAYLTEYILQPNQDKIRVLNPEAGDTPGMNEVWLPYHFSINYNLEVGDTLKFQFSSGSFDFIISSFVVDPHFLSGLFNPTRIFVSPGALAVFQPFESLNTIMVGIRTHELNDTASIYSRFLSEIDFSGSKLEYSLFKAAFNGIYSLFSSAILVIGFLVFLITLIGLYGTLISQVLEDYRQIGILKALGFTPNSIRVIYLTKVLVIILPSLLLGIVVAHYSLMLIVDYMNHSSRLSYQPKNLLGAYVISGTCISAVTLITTWLTTYKAGKISPREAIQIGISVKSSSIKSPIKYSSLSPEAIMGTQFTVGRLLSNLILGFSFAIFSFLLLFIFSVGYSLDSVKSHKPDWGLLDADLQVGLNQSVFLPLDKSDFLNLFSSFASQTDKIIPFSYAELKILTENDIVEARGIIYDLKLEETGFTNLSGSHPDDENDISLGIGTAREAQMSVGDTIQILIEGTLKSMRVCGIYQDISAFGQGFRLHTQSMRSVNPLFQPNQFGIALNESVHLSSFKEELESFFGEKVSVENSLELRTAFLSTIQSIKAGTFVVSLFFVVILMILVSNDMNIHVNRDKLVITKLKAIGFTNLQVKYAFLIKNTLVTITGVLLGIFLTVVAGKSLISKLTIGMGLAEFPLEIPLFLIVLVGVVVMALGYLGALNSLRSIHSIKPTDSKAD